MCVCVARAVSGGRLRRSLPWRSGREAHVFEAFGGLRPAEADYGGVVPESVWLRLHGALLVSALPVGVVAHR